MSGSISIEGRDVVTLDTFTATELLHVVERARAMKASPPGPRLQGRALAMIFFDPSLRTRTSFTVAFATLGGAVVDMAAGRDLWPLDFREGVPMDGAADEHVRDAAAVLSQHADLLAIRALPRRRDWAQERRDMVIVSFQKHAQVPIFNMEGVLDHPCQAWADAMTLSETLGDVRGKRLTLAWSYHPKARSLAVPHGVATMATRLGMDVTVAHPEGFPLDHGVRANLEHSSREAGGALRFVHDLDEGLDGADVVYAAPWGSIHLNAEPDAEAAARSRHTDWRITSGRMARTREARFMHALPIRRNLEADDAVVDAPGSLVLPQAANRLHIQRALFCEVLGS
jgi:N-acetylornithine carbamoyltransferase